MSRMAKNGVISVIVHGMMYVQKNSVFKNSFINNE